MANPVSALTIETTRLSRFELFYDRGASPMGIPESEGNYVGSGIGSAVGALEGALRWSLYEKRRDDHCAMYVIGFLETAEGSRKFEGRGFALAGGSSGYWNVAGSIYLAEANEPLLWTGRFDPSEHRARWLVFTAGEREE